MKAQRDALVMAHHIASGVGLKYIYLQNRHVDSPMIQARLAEEIALAPQVSRQTASSAPQPRKGGCGGGKRRAHPRGIVTTVGFHVDVFLLVQGASLNFVHQVDT
jgi:hypothetical protein